jgi:hypothetical protein
VHMVMLEAVQEIRIIFYLLTSMFIQVKLTVIVKFDNVVAIFMAQNLSFRVHIRHVDTRYHFVYEHIVDDFTNIVLFKSCENDADLFTFTKGVSKDTYKKHVHNFLGKMDDSKIEY